MSRHTVFFKRVSLLIALCFMAASTHAEIYYLHNDHLGNPQAVTDENRNIVWQGEYSPFGELVTETGTLKQPHRFPGQHADPETGLYYNYFRDYDPSLGRYVQSDPIGLAGGINTYGYVGGNPVNFVDPTGEIAFAIPAVAGLAAGLAASTPQAQQALSNFAQSVADTVGGMFNDATSSDPYGGYDPTDEKDAEDMANNPSGYESCAEIQEAIVALQNRINGRKENCDEYGGGDKGHRDRIKNLQRALDKLRQMLASCKN